MIFVTGPEVCIVYSRWKLFKVKASSQLLQAKDQLLFVSEWHFILLLQVILCIRVTTIQCQTCIFVRVTSNWTSLLGIIMVWQATLHSQWQLVYKHYVFSTNIINHIRLFWLYFVNAYFFPSQVKDGSAKALSNSVSEALSLQKEGAMSVSEFAGLIETISSNLNNSMSDNETNAVRRYSAFSQTFNCIENHLSVYFLL